MLKLLKRGKRYWTPKLHHGEFEIIQFHKGVSENVYKATGNSDTIT